MFTVWSLLFWLSCEFTRYVGWVLLKLFVHELSESSSVSDSQVVCWIGVEFVGLVNWCWMSDVSCKDWMKSLDIFSLLWFMSCKWQRWNLIYLLPFLKRTCCPSCLSTFAGPCHELLSRHLIYTESSVRYLISPCEIFNITRSLYMWESAHLNFSEFSQAMNASLAFWFACRFLQISFFVGVDVSAR